MLFADLGFDDLIDLFLRLDQHLNHWAAVLGPWLYVVVFAIIFCETGLVITPILPGDSLLFALGALAATDKSPLDVWLLFVLLCIAAILGDAVNYAVGAYVGPKVFTREKSWLLNKKHLLYAQTFYERWGSLTIVVCRFAPIVRTFGPFVAGIGRMRYPKFAGYNVAGGIAWVAIFLFLGFFCGSWEWVKSNFSVIIIGIILISLMPMAVIAYFERRRNLKAKAAEPLLQARGTPPT